MKTENNTIVLRSFISNGCTVPEIREALSPWIIRNHAEVLLDRYPGPWPEPTPLGTSCKLGVIYGCQVTSEGLAVTGEYRDIDVIQKMLALGASLCHVEIALRLCEASDGGNDLLETINQIRPDGSAEIRVALVRHEKLGSDRLLGISSGDGYRGIIDAWSAPPDRRWGEAVAHIVSLP